MNLFSTLAVAIGADVLATSVMGVGGTRKLAAGAMAGVGRSASSRALTCSARRSGPIELFGGPYV